MYTQTKRKMLLVMLLLMSIAITSAAEHVINVSQSGVNAANSIAQALEKAAAMNGRPVVIKLAPGVWRIPREDATSRPYYVSNTTSEHDCANPTKHIALLLRGLRNVVVDGCGSTLMLDGEMTAFVIDSCQNITLRSWSPTDDVVDAREMEQGKLYIKYSKKPQVGVGTVLQMRDGYRREVCGLIWRSKGVTLDGVRFYYLGNFGVVGQVSEDITVRHCWFAPEEGSGRTNAGFADLIQISGCRGLIDITDSKFAGAHDDPINIHGTHLRIVRQTAANRLQLRYMHPQTYGFQSFHKGDSIEIVNPETLLPVGSYKVRSARMLSPREIEITLTRPVDSSLLLADRVVENITWTPRVHIARCHFSRIATRGILITTRRPSIIEDNTFYAMQMSALLVADDARSWFESGPVHNLTIRRNIFNRCVSPVIWVAPENIEKAGPVHRNITIENNVFTLCDAADKPFVTNSVANLKVKDNIVIRPE